MGDNLYTAYWQIVLPYIIQQFKEGKEIVQLPVKDLAQIRPRDSYYTNFSIHNGELEKRNNAQAYGRDLFDVLSQDSFFKENLVNKTLHVNISKDLVLKIEVLPEDAPAFFTEEDFIQLSRFTKERIDDANEEHRKTYEFLKNTYNKTEYWAKRVNKKIFPNGIMQVRKRPTNQASRFEYYQWAKIYPDKTAADYAALAFTVGIDTDNQFVVKIDTIGLGMPEQDERRKQYLEIRGDYKNSSIVKILPAEQVLDKGWQYLIDLSSNLILELKPSFDSILQILKGASPSTVNQKGKENNKGAMALNTILYGPPGTGKTYNSISKAVSIANPNFPMATASRNSIKKEYERLKGEKQIEFITFHQSLSYEDFIEGIKPIRPDNTNTLLYDIVDGIFKRICNEATRVNQFSVTIDLVSKPLTQELFESLYYSFSETLPLHTESTSTVQLKTKEGNLFDLFKNTADSIVVKAGQKRTNSTVSFNELSAVLFENKTPTYKSYEQIIIEKILEDKNFQKSNVDNTQKNYVLIIDEINRGNVSQILGELITLIEEDKRAGKEESLTVTLPYSKKTFSVPENLYLIGTMNTADRSVEALDTALRRRFTFEAIKPNENLLSPQNLIVRFFNCKYVDTDWNDKEYRKAASKLYSLIGIHDSFEKTVRQDEDSDRADDDKVRALKDTQFTGVNLQTLLRIINKRLEALLTKDHTIGHAWLMNVYSLEDLQSAFKSKILPLLQEFFYNDYAKIGLVLGKRFVEAKPIGQKIFADFDDGNELATEYTDKMIYYLKDPYDLTKEDFISIYR